jgi:hypothetical protein
MKTNRILLNFLMLPIAIAIFFSCDDVENTKVDDVMLKASTCDQNVIISELEYQHAPNEHFTITEIKIEGDCLNIKFSASGCDGTSWKVKLIDSGNIAESYPCQRWLRLSLENKEMCDAVFEKEISFNIKGLQIQGNDKVILHVSGNEILYEY